MKIIDWSDVGSYADLVLGVYLIFGIGYLLILIWRWARIRDLKNKIQNSKRFLIRKPNHPVLVSSIEHCLLCLIKQHEKLCHLEVSKFFSIKDLNFIQSTVKGWVEPYYNEYQKVTKSA